MNLTIFEGKNKDELKQKLIEELNVSENEVLFSYETKKGGLFKSESYIIKGIKLTDVKDAIVDYLKDLVTNMGLDVQMESNIRDNQINIKMFSNNNPILIGKNGQTLIALQNIVKQMVYAKINVYPYILLDVENYKDKKQNNLEYHAKKIAKEVQRTKQDAILDDMNSYERKIIHDVLTNFKNIKTESEGEEPHRHIIIKYVEE
ncbi:MAG: KH domain-containing protein [Bacilli bacterium]|nr:KH domain-containing protein [Bacilli bacterium]